MKANHMNSIHLIGAATVLIVYLRWEFLSPVLDKHTKKPVNKARRALPFIGFMAAAVLIQAAVSLNSRPASFVLLGVGSIVLLASASYGVVRRMIRR